MLLSNVIHSLTCQGKQRSSAIHKTCLIKKCIYRLRGFFSYLRKNSINDSIVTQSISHMHNLYCYYAIHCTATNSISLIKGPVWSLSNDALGSRYDKSRSTL